ncbi:MAG: polymer-forming cytoskeletal protein [Gemmatimonadaceae bacterium]|nr:polymer-forming cytoskeletal protein [Gemmatimonadaceae bacterium]
MVRHLTAAVAMLLAIGGAERLPAQQPDAVARDSASRTLDSARATSAGRNIPSLYQFSWGDLTIPAGQSVDGPVAAARGTVDVRGQVHGDVFTLGGDIRVHEGGEITGNALALQGKVIVEGGRVGGELKASAPLGVAAADTKPELTGSAAVRHALNITLAWFAIVVLVGLGVIVFSSAQLEGVVQALERRFGAALLLGIAAQVGALPLLVLLCLALALTVVGILLIPFAVVAYILGAAGLVTLGGLAAATVAGRAVVREGPNVRVRAVRSLMLGATLFILPWVANALLVNSTWGGAIVRVLAVALTWVAVSAGLGAALMARGGVRRVYVHRPSAPVNADGWQTPTPIGGIVAARRPAATPSSPSGAAN